MDHAISIEALPYWEGLAQEHLLLQQCTNCGAIRHYPRSMCRQCQSTGVAWKQAAGDGVVHSWTVTYRTNLPGFREAVPFAMVTADLVEGVRILARLQGSFSDLRVGSPVRVQFEKQEDGTMVPALVRLPL